MTKRTLALVGLMGGCSVVDSGDGNDTVDTLPDCGETAPTFTGALTITDAGTVDFRGTPKRAVQLTAPVADEDGDLYQYRVQIWYDTLADGKFDQASPQVNFLVDLGDPSVGADTAGPCHFERATGGAKVPMGEGDVPMGEEVEFGLVISDAAGNPTNAGEPLIGVFATPAE